MINMAWKVYGAEGHRQKESFNQSKVLELKTRFGGCRMFVYNSDVTGTNEYSLVAVEAQTITACKEVFSAQLSDGLFENCRTGVIERFDVYKLDVYNQKLHDLLYGCRHTVDIEITETDVPRRDSILFFNRNYYNRESRVEITYNIYERLCEALRTVKSEYAIVSVWFYDGAEHRLHGWHYTNGAGVEQAVWTCREKPDHWARKYIPDVVVNKESLKARKCVMVSI